jgi:tetratricopeptide (TPR) repeat protein
MVAMSHRKKKHRRDGKTSPSRPPHRLIGKLPPGVFLRTWEISDEPVKTREPELNALVYEGMQALNAGDGVRAEALLRRVLELDPDAPDLLNNLAAAYTLQGRMAEGDELIRSIHERFPDYLFGPANLAGLYVRQGELGKARALVEPLLSRRKMHTTEFAALCMAMIDILVAEGERKSARAWWRCGRASNQTTRILPCGDNASIAGVCWTDCGAGSMPKTRMLKVERTRNERRHVSQRLPYIRYCNAVRKKLGTSD